MLDRYLHSSVESITLQVTQQCNLKCNYCPYSGSYYNREHSNRHSSINWDVTESLDTLTYVTLDKNFIDEEVRKCNAYSVYDSDSIKQFSEQLINTLVGYDNYPTL